ncbi:MAG: hypothetical protein IM613_17115 [Cytophagales bacterium]|nr:hypothetical protein [Cytophagales bacterium]
MSGNNTEFTVYERVNKIPDVPLETLNDLDDSGGLKGSIRIRSYNLSVYHDLLVIRIVKTLRKHGKPNYTKRQVLEKGIAMIAAELGRRGMAIEKLEKEDIELTVSKGNRISKGIHGASQHKTTPASPSPVNNLDDF